MASISEGKKAPGYKGKVLRTRLGKGWQKKVYGKKYKYGTVKKLNEGIKTNRSDIKSRKELLRTARKNLKSSEGNDTNKAAIEARIKTLIDEKNSAAQQIKGSKEQRQKFLNLREKAISTTAGKLSTNQVGSARKAKVKAKLDETTTNGGTTAPNDSSAQNNRKPHKVNVGEQRTNEYGAPKGSQKQPKTSEGKKNKAQRISGGTTAR